MSAGMTVMVRDAAPVGWIGVIRSITGTTLLIETNAGIWRNVDSSRHSVKVI